MSCEILIWMYLMNKMLYWSADFIEILIFRYIFLRRNIIGTSDICVYLMISEALPSSRVYGNLASSRGFRQMPVCLVVLIPFVFSLFRCWLFFSMLLLFVFLSETVVYLKNPCRCYLNRLFWCSDMTDGH